MFDNWRWALFMLITFALPLWLSGAGTYFNFFNLFSQVLPELAVQVTGLTVALSLLYMFVHESTLKKLVFRNSVIANVGTLLSAAASVLALIDIIQADGSIRVFRVYSWLLAFALALIAIEMICLFAKEVGGDRKGGGGKKASTASTDNGHTNVAAGSEI